MPGHFTHIYTARRVAEHLLEGQFPEWPQEGSPLLRFDPVKCGNVMQKWEKFTAIGAVGPDLFYFSQDYNSSPLGPLSDELMLSFAVYYFFDAAKEHDWEPLLLILDGVNSTMAGLLRILIKLQKIWQAFVDGWNKTIGPFVAVATGLGDALTGGLLSEFGTVIDELKLAIKNIAEEELLTYKDIFSLFDTCVQKGFDEQLFLWSDMSHYRRPSGLCQAFVRQVETLAERGQTDEADQFLAFTLGYITHLGTDTVAHSFVNEQCGGPYRNHPQRHHLIENHIDAWNYAQTGPDGAIAPDPWAQSETYPDLSTSALWFAVQLTPDKPQGEQRPNKLPTDPQDRKKALDVDGEMPEWMANAIVAALIDTFDQHDHPKIFQGSAFQAQIGDSLLTDLIERITGSGPDKPLPELLKGIAPTPPFDVPVGFPLPWQIQTVYRIMITFYRLSYNGGWELEKPRKPDFIILPPASDIENLLQPPDLSGVDTSNLIDDVCGTFIALLDWAVKALEAAGQLVADLIKMLASPASYLLRLGLYELAMVVWDVVTKTHEILAHTGFLLPRAEQFYPGGELRLPGEIDLPLITLGGTVDGAFRAALEAAADPFGNLDRNQDVIGVTHPLPDENYPYYPVLKYAGPNTTGMFDGFEFHRPWAYPNVSVFGNSNHPIRTPTETYNPQASFGEGPSARYKPLQAGPYPLGTMPNVFFRTNAPVDPALRSQYEAAQTPWHTDTLNRNHLANQGRLHFSPLGDPIPFSAHLIGQLANDTGYSTQFNLDSDRAFAYLTWDWVRSEDRADGILGLSYAKPAEPPQGATGWARGDRPMLLHYVDPPAVQPGPMLK